MSTADTMQNPGEIPAGKLWLFLHIEIRPRWRLEAGAARHAQLEDISEDLGHGLVQRRRDLRADIDVSMQHSGERRRLEDRHIVFRRDLTNARGDQIDALATTIGARMRFSS